MVIAAQYPGVRVTVTGGRAEVLLQGLLDRELDLVVCDMSKFEDSAFAHDIMVQGPLYGTVSAATSSFLTSLHEANRWVIITLVVLHLLAVAWHTLAKKEPLVRAMIAGDMPADHLPADAQASADGAGVRLRALVLAIVVAAFVLWIRSLGS